jgi:hypothetical protein
MIHVIIFKSGLWDFLCFEEFEFFLEVYKIRGANKSVVEIVSLEDIIDIESLNFIDGDGEDALKRIRS